MKKPDFVYGVRPVVWVVEVKDSDNGQSLVCGIDFLRMSRLDMACIYEQLAAEVKGFL